MTTKQNNNQNNQQKQTTTTTTKTNNNNKQASKNIVTKHVIKNIYNQTNDRNINRGKTPKHKHRTNKLKSEPEL